MDKSTKYAKQISKRNNPAKMNVKERSANKTKKRVDLNSDEREFKVKVFNIKRKGDVTLKTG